MQFLRKYNTCKLGFKVQAPFANFSREILGKDEIGPKPYGTIGVTLPGFLSISYISFPHRPHSTLSTLPTLSKWPELM